MRDSVMEFGRFNAWLRRQNNGPFNFGPAHYSLFIPYASLSEATMIDITQPCDSIPIAERHSELQRRSLAVLNQAAQTLTSAVCSDGRL